ncbi:oxidative stress-responsive serine-rich protein 1 [Corythoichthys intestinalis]|uniref:oxidative stress-responsive serine-rich protein 1 n=1 Tax=Corythoichthys intestinalis TaxID=161448 RepID=UPI0025A4E9FA|nr:oxidative stress-responsive serine-rich protein 1 [Corythoichthys intestinalis]
MAAGGPEREEDEVLQTAFKKLRVDADSALPVPGGGPEVPPAAARDTGAPKSKHSASKDNWHGCVRKTARGASRTPRRRRSESPILHPPRFTYSAPAGGSEQRTEPAPEPPARIWTLHLGGKDEESSAAVREKDCARSDDFGLLSERCSAASLTTRAYSFTGARDVVTERRKGAPPSRSGGPTPPSASPRSCSSQALVSVDDVTMDDLAGYMEFYLYIPKKMSHMAEMMYT